MGVAMKWRAFGRSFNAWLESFHPLNTKLSIALSVCSLILSCAGITSFLVACGAQSISGEGNCWLILGFWLQICAVILVLLSCWLDRGSSPVSSKERTD